jgi:hypothetical protein
MILRTIFLCVVALNGVLGLDRCALAGGPEPNGQESAVDAAVVARFGKPDSFRDGGKTFEYKLQNGDVISIQADQRGNNLTLSHKLNLARLVGKQVMLSGVYEGPGKLGDFFLVNGAEPIYLRGANHARYGDRVSVTGTLRHYDYIPPTDPTVAAAHEHYYFDKDKVLTVWVSAGPPSWSNYLEKSVTIEGEAENRKMGAYLLMGHGAGIWITGLPQRQWPNEIYSAPYRGKRVRVTGIVAEQDDLPLLIDELEVAKVQGIPVPNGADPKKTGKRYVLKDIVWNVIE